MNEYLIRFHGISTFCKLPHTRNLEGVDVAFIGVPMDQVTGSGAAYGTKAIRGASRIYGTAYSYGNRLFDIETKKFILEDLNMIDYGDIIPVLYEVEENIDLIYGYFKEILQSKVFPVAIGGDHSITFPIVKAFGDIPLDIIHFDTHLDFQESVTDQEITFSHASPIRRISELKNINKITQIGIRGLQNGFSIYEDAKKTGLNIITAEESIEHGTTWTLKQIPKAENIYVTIDIDVMDPSVAPATGLAEPGGFNYHQIKKILTALPQKGNIVGFDLVEVNPQFDLSECTAQLASRIILDFLGTIMEAKKKRKQLKERRKTVRIRET
ncbi:MAG TPA: arginase family protein [Candidatus Eremiobacteraeota bacterium]|nr:MAG: Proclavaminate amidinohydrolase [bacterium ADurb.Bin363]HPZ09749.1 arginase family protein [Candidatus Eremiobacteraeota bacterium]